MSTITKAYFANNPNLIPNLQSNNGEDADVYAAKIAKLDSAIRRYEKEYLQLLLGKELYAEYITTIADAKWNGLKALLYDDTNKESPIANYIFCGYVIENALSYNGQVVSTTKQENSTNVDPTVLRAISWNKMVSANEVIFQYLIDTDITTTAYLENSGWYKLSNRENWFYA